MKDAPKMLLMYLLGIAVGLPILFLSITCNAASYYISQSGSDTNNGTAPETPWRTCGKVYAKSTSTSKFQPGDSILLQAGGSFSGSLRINGAGNSGTAAARLTIDRYGDGENPIIYGDHSDAAWTAVANHPEVYSVNVTAGGGSTQAVYDTNGVKYAKLSQGADTLDTWLGKFQPANWGFASPFVYIRTTDDNPPPSMHLFEFAAVELDAVSYATIQNLDIRACNIGITVGTGSHVVVQNNHVQDTIGIGILYQGGSSFGEIGTNTCERCGDSIIYLQTGGSNWVHYNAVSYSGSNSAGMLILGCQVPKRESCGIGLERGTNNIVEFNSISKVFGSCFDYWLEVGSEVRFNTGFHSGGAAYPDGTGLKLHDNTFDLDLAGPGIGGGHDHQALSPAPDAGSNSIYNNSVSNFINYGIFFATNGTGVTVRSNSFVTSSLTAKMVEVHPGVDMDYDSFFCTGGTPKGWYWSEVNRTTLPAFQSASGQELHGQYSDPRTNQPPPAPTRPAPPTNLRVIQSSSSGVSLEWDYDFAANPGVDSFLTAWGLSDLTAFNVGGPATSSTVTGLARGKTYTFAVEAMAGGIESDLSNEVQATIPKNGGSHFR